MPSRLDRRLFLASLGSAGMLAACSGRHASTLPVLGAVRPLTGGATLTFDLTTTDLPSGTPVYAYIVGLVSAAHNTYYRIDATGAAHVMQAADATYLAGTFPGKSGLSSAAQQALAPNYPTAWADYSIPLTVGAATAVPLSGFSTVSMPELGTGTAAFSGRIFLSVGVPKLPITPTGSATVAGGGTGAGGWTAPVFTTPPGNLTLFDWIEFSLDSNGNFDANTTQVDQFGFPLGLTASPLSVGTATGPLLASRDTIISGLGGILMYSGSASAVVPVPSAAAGAYTNNDPTKVIANLRAISPNSLITENCYLGPLATYFFDTIRQWYATWTTNVLQTHDISSGWYSGFVPTSGALAGILVFYKGQLTLAQVQQNLSNGQTPDIILTGQYGSPVTRNTAILSSDILGCANTLDGGNVGSTPAGDAKNVCKMLAAAFNRGVVNSTLDDGSCPAATSFYPTGAGAPLWNQWAQKMHSYDSNGLSYAFAYDDVCSQSTSIQSNPVTNATITLGKFFS